MHDSVNGIETLTVFDVCLSSEYFLTCLSFQPVSPIGDHPLSFVLRKDISFFHFNKLW